MTDRVGQWYLVAREMQFIAYGLFATVGVGLIAAAYFLYDLVRHAP